VRFFRADFFVFLCGEDAARIYKNESGRLVKQDGTDSGEDIVYISLCFSVSVSLFLCVVKVNSISQKRA